MKYFKCSQCYNRGEANNRTAILCCEKHGAMELIRQDDKETREDLAMIGERYDGEW